ncbi:MAG: phytanoyl-CoA dioxygenase family protein [Alcaligenaceae bacterium]
MTAQAILSGVPLVESPFFKEIASSNYFDEHEAEIAADLNLYGFAVLPGFYTHIAQQAQQIKHDLEPIFNGEQSIGRAPPSGEPVNRIQDAFKVSATVKQIALEPQILALLSKLYGRQAFAFQTLNFKQGSQQAAHSDSVHFSSAPERFMCGVWVALEDVALDAGPLCYYPGSHTLPIYDCRQVGFTPSDTVDQTVYEPTWNKLIEVNGLRKKVFIARAGDALIWAANLLHGGEPILRPGATRWSQVTHYYFDGCKYYTPMQSDLIVEKIAKRDPINIASGLPISKGLQAGAAASGTSGTGSNDGVLQGLAQSAGSLLGMGNKLIGNLFGQKRVKAPVYPEIPLPADFDEQTYLFLNPDLAGAELDPATHYARHGHTESRPYQIKVPEDFSAAEYLKLNPDVATAGLDPVRHYVLHGYREGRPYQSV